MTKLTRSRPIFFLKLWMHFYTSKDVFVLLVNAG